MTDRSIFVRLGAIASGLKKELRESAVEANKTAAAVEQAGRKADAALAKTAAKVPLLSRGLAAFKKTSAEVSAFVTKNRDDIDRLATSGLVVGALLVAGVSVAAKRYADFDQQMSNVAATGVDARQSLGALRETAIQLGADTVFSASEAAQGIEAMEKAGLSAKDILGGGLRGSLSLAAAGSLDVASAAEVAATALVQFKLTGADMGHVADLLAAGAGKAQGEVSDLALALKYVGPIASGMNISLEETVGALSAFASQGILADQAGTSLRGVLAALTSPSKQAQAEISRLGITLYDQNGAFLGLANMAGQLEKAYAGVSDEAKDASLGILFGNNQVTAARVLFDQGAKGIQDWTAKVDEAGYAATVAATRMDNLSGDVERLGGSIDSALIQSGTGLNEALRGVVQTAEMVVDAIGQIPPGALGAVSALAGTGGLGVLGVSALGKLAVGIHDARTAMVGLTGSTRAAGLAAGALGAAIGVGAIAFSIWAQRATEARQNAQDFESTMTVVGNTVTLTTGTLQQINTKLAETNTLFGWGPSLMDLMDQVGVSASDAQGYLLGEADAVDKVNAAFDAYIRSHPFEGATPVALLQKGLDDLGGSMSKAKKDLLQKARADEQAGIATKGHTDATQTMVAYLNNETDALGTATTSLQDYETALWSAADAALKLSGTKIGFRQAVDDSMKEIGDKKHKGKGLNTHTQVGRDNQGDLNKIVSSGKAMVNSLLETEGPGKKAAAAMKEVRESYIEAATAATGSKTKAIEMADALNLIPKNVTPDIKPTLNDEAIKIWRKYHPEDKTPWITPKLKKSTLNVNVVYHMKGGPGFSADADGGIHVKAGNALVRAFADGGIPSIGSQQPQIQPNHGPKGIMWAETGAGPWEAFISGHPGKQARSRAIASDVVSRLGGVAQFADGGVLQRTLYSQRPGPTINFNGDVYYPVAEPPSVTNNRSLQSAAALGFGG